MNSAALRTAEVTLERSYITCMKEIGADWFYGTPPEIVGGMPSRIAGFPSGQRGGGHHPTGLYGSRSMVSIPRSRCPVASGVSITSVYSGWRITAITPSGVRMSSDMSTRLEFASEKDLATLLALVDKVPGDDILKGPTFRTMIARLIGPLVREVNWHREERRYRDPVVKVARALAKRARGTELETEAQRVYELAKLRCNE